MKEQSSCQALPLIPSTPRMTDYGHKEYQLLFSSSSIPADARGTDRAPRAQGWEQGGHLCINPSALARLEFHFFPALLPLTGHKPVLLGQASRSSDYEILATFFSSPLFHSKQFLWSTRLVMGWVMLFTEIPQINLEFHHVST